MDKNEPETLESVARTVNAMLSSDSSILLSTSSIIEALRQDCTDRALPCFEELESIVMGEQGDPDVEATRARFPRLNELVASQF